MLIKMEWYVAVFFVFIPSLLECMHPVSDREFSIQQHEAKLPANFSPESLNYIIDQWRFPVSYKEEPRTAIFIEDGSTDKSVQLIIKMINEKGVDINRFYLIPLLHASYMGDDGGAKLNQDIDEVKAYGNDVVVIFTHLTELFLEGQNSSAAVLDKQDVVRTFLAEIAHNNMFYLIFVMNAERDVPIWLRNNASNKAISCIVEVKEAADSRSNYKPQKGYGEIKSCLTQTILQRVLKGIQQQYRRTWLNGNYVFLPRESLLPSY